MPPETALPLVLSQYGFPASVSAVPLGANSGFSGAMVWRVDEGGEAFALRCTPESAVVFDRLQGLHRLLNWTEYRGVTQIPAPRKTGAGDSFIRHAGSVWQLEPWMKGAADFHVRPGTARLTSAMHALALFHRAAAEFQAAPDERPWFFSEIGPSPGLIERLKHIHRWDERQRTSVRSGLARVDWTEFRVLGNEVLRLFEQHAPRIWALLLPMRDVEFPLQPCLRDVWHDHLLFTGDELTGLIDPHASRSDCVATDLARCLGSLVRDDREAWDYAIQAYQEVRPLSFDERAAVELFDRSGVLLNGLTWLEWVCVRGRVFPARERVIARMKEIVSRMERL